MLYSLEFLMNANTIVFTIAKFFVFFSYFIQSRVFCPQLTLRQLIQPDLESRFIVRSQFGPSVQSDSSPNAGLQVVTQSTHLSKDCYPKLVPNPQRSEIRPPKQLDILVDLALCSKQNTCSVNKIHAQTCKRNARKEKVQSSNLANNAPEQLQHCSGV